ncbi:MAG: hypothetical protein WC943_16575 [Elusimicrobiota bacterium]|jgi:hypothetical protein
MKKLLFAVVAALFAVSWSYAAVEVTVDPGIDLNEIIKKVNIEAKANFGAFQADLSARFNQPAEKVESVIKSLETPGDAFMALKVAEAAKKPVEDVVKEYQANKGQGWGQLAKSMGIKPGSAEFKALKNKDFKGKGKGKQMAQEKSKGKPAKGGGKGKGKGKK